MKKKATNFGLDKTGRPNWSMGRKGDASLADHDRGIDSFGRRNASLEEATRYVECEEGEPYKPGPALPGAEELVAEAVPEACLGYPDYKYSRGNGFFKKGSSARAFYKKNGYHKLKVYKAGGYNRGKVVYKFFKEVVKSA